MKTIGPLALAVAACSAAALHAADAPAKTPATVAGNRPNFVLIMADDLGYGSLGCYGGNKVRTPQIDRLAADGMRFTDYHANSPYCSPTRAAMLTGRYPERCAWVDDAKLSPVYQQQRRKNLKQRFAWGLDPGEVTLPAVLHGAGYRTGLIGKWHLGYERPFHPLNYGFDEFRGFVGGNVDYHTHYAEFGQHELDWWNGKKIENEPGYATDLLTGYTVDFIKRHREQPFLLWLTYGAPHVPLQGRDPKAKKAPAATYIEMIETVDEGVGRVRQALRENGLEKNTLLVFCSDNGADNSRGIAANGPLRGLKGELSEGGHRVPCIACWPGRITAGSLCGQTVMGMDWFATFAGLAGASLPSGFQPDGVQLGGVLTHQAKLESRAVYWLMEDRWAVREGSWKLLGRDDQPQELYHLGQDLGESRNLLADQAEVVRKLLQHHQAWLGDVYAQRKQPPELKLAPPHSPDAIYDLVVYGDSSGAVIAAISAKREGRSVIWVNPTGFAGGMSASGLGATDFLGRRNTFGGIASEFYDGVAKAYGTDFVRSFEPHVGKQVFEQMIADAGVTVVYNEKLDRTSGKGVTMDGKRIKAITTLSGKTYHGKMFIDATYVGDLMAAAGVTYTVGREPESQYGEDMAGVRRGDTKPRVHYGQRDKDHFVKEVDAYVKPGDTNSGLLPRMFKVENLKNGQGDRKIQAYTYRVCLTTDPQLRIPIEKPAGYREIDHELLLRNFDAGDDRLPALIEPLAGGKKKVDWNNMHAVGSDHPGGNWDYPEASYERRREIEKEHETYIRGFLWTMANNPRVPEGIRKKTAAYGLPKDEFTDNGGWPWMIYIREARRMVSDYVMTQHNCEGKKSAPDPVAPGSFGMDSHVVQHFVTEAGHANSDGVIWRVPPKPYGISYRSIIPRKGECENLLSPICVSASHVAHGSIRMEPVFMALSQSAAVAAGLAIDSRVSVQDVAYPALHEKLLAAKQVVDASQVPAPKPKAAKRKSAP